MFGIVGGRNMNFQVIEREVLKTEGRAGRVRGSLRRRQWFLLFVGAPTLLSAIYYGFVASDVYVSHSSFVVKTPGQKAPSNLSIANLLQTTGMTAGQEQTKEVLAYLRSRNALEDLQAQIDVRKQYSHEGADLLSRFPSPLRSDTFENLYRFYGSMVGADVDPESGVATLSVKAFTPDDAYRTNARLLELSEELVNRLNQRAEGKAIAEGERRVQEAETRVRNARLAIGQYRNSQDLIDPGKQATGVLDVSNKLVAEQASLQTQLDLMRRMTPRNPAIPAVESRIVAVGREIAAQNGRVMGTPDAIASKLSAYEKLNVEQEFATQMLTAANTSLEQARDDAEKQQFYVERIVEPDKPDLPALPERLKQVLVIFASLICLYFVGWMIIVGILEHAPED